MDSVIDDSHQSLYPTEFLNTISISGLPPHKLTLKIGQPIMMLRNLNPNEGQLSGKVVYIPRMPLIPSDTNLPFDFQRTQFPIRPAFSMTINKFQVNLYL